MLQLFFKNRLFAPAFPVSEKSIKSSVWNFKLKHVYTVVLLNFDLKDEALQADAICHCVKLCDIATHKVFYDKLDFIYVEIAKFNKAEDELITLYGKWLYVLKILSSLTKRPSALVDKVF